MTNPTVPPAGWYLDPTGRHGHRYWDGRAWTEAVADDGQMSSDPPVRYPAAGPGPLDAGEPATHPASAAGPAPARAAAAVQSGPAPEPVPGAEPTLVNGPLAAEPTLVNGPHAAEPTLVAGPALQQQPAWPPLAAAAPKPRRRKWWLLAAVLVAVLVLGGGAAGWVLWTRPGPSPQRLTASGVTSSSVQLAWSPPANGSPPEHYLVRRNGKVVARLGAEPSYQDSGLAPLTSYRYSILAVVHGRQSHPTADLLVRTRPASPQGLTGRAESPTVVTLSWSAPPGPAPDRYQIIRNGTDLATVPAGTLSYRDGSLTPLTEVSYTVVAVTQGQTSEPSAALQLTTPSPSAAEARLQDSWDVTLTVTNAGQTRLKNGDSSGETWSFRPQCATGPCAVKLSGTLGGEPFTMTLNRTGATYRGSAKARVANCVNTPVNNTVSVTIKVTDGEMRSGSWAASDWTGNLKLAGAYTVSGNYYCPAQSATFSITPDSTAGQTT